MGKFTSVKVWKGYFCNIRYSFECGGRGGWGRKRCCCIAEFGVKVKVEECTARANQCSRIHTLRHTSSRWIHTLGHVSWCSWDTLTVQVYWVARGILQWTCFIKRSARNALTNPQCSLIQTVRYAPWLGTARML